MPQVPQAIRLARLGDPEMRYLQEQGGATADGSRLRPGPIDQLDKVIRQAEKVEVAVYGEDVPMMNMTPKEAVQYAFPRHERPNTDQIVSLLQYLFKEGFAEEGPGASVKFTAEGRAVVARRRKDLGLPE